jgi:glycosyltransferase involved in cell wall biosynthesis
MKIGYLIQQDVDIRNPPFTGPASHVREVVRALEGRGYQIRTLANIGGSYWVTDDLETYHPVHSRWMQRGPIRWFERAVRRIQSELRLPYAALFESLRFAMICHHLMKDRDLLYERMSWVSYGGGLAALRLGIPLILENNGDHLADLKAKGIAPKGVQRWISTTLMNVAVKLADHVVVTGEGWRKAFLNRYAFDPDRTTTIENGTNLIHMLSRDELRSFKPPPPNARRTHLVYLGGFYPWQGVPVLIHACSIALNEGADIELTLIGSGSGLNEAKTLAQDTALADRIHFTGRLTPGEFAPILANADIAAAPYCGWPEFSGLKIFDYKAAGLPTIASGRDGHPVTVKHKQTGWIVPPCDEHALVDAILELASNRALRIKMGRAARLEAERGHGWEHTAARLDRLLVEISEKGPVSPDPQTSAKNIQENPHP